jgi:hypothetical protein
MQAAEIKAVVHVGDVRLFYGKFQFPLFRQERLKLLT